MGCIGGQLRPRSLSQDKVIIVETRSTKMILIFFMMMCIGILKYHEFSILHIRCNSLNTAIYGKIILDHEWLTAYTTIQQFHRQIAIRERLD